MDADEGANVARSPSQFQGARKTLYTLHFWSELWIEGVDALFTAETACIHSLVRSPSPASAVLPPPAACETRHVIIALRGSAADAHPRLARLRAQER